MKNIFFTSCIIFLLLSFSVREINASSIAEKERMDNSCLECHSDVGYEEATHSDLSCLECHGKAGEFSHDDPVRLSCRECHSSHYLDEAHDPHISVACEACHLNDAKPFRNSGDNVIAWKREAADSEARDIHIMPEDDEREFCARCHHRNNNLGAAASVLPARGVICLPCHSAAVSAEDIVTVSSVIIFLLGSIGIILIWLTGAKILKNRSKLTAKKIFQIIKSFILDGLMQRRLLKASLLRWILHSMIFFPLALRFLWGLFGLFVSACLPEWDVTEIVFNKNHPVTAIFFDITGALIILGGCCMIVRKKLMGEGIGLHSLPKTDIPAWCLIGLILITGFVLEGMRISMTGSPEGAEYAFIGYALSRLFTGFELTNIYGYMWYFHAVLTGAFVAYLPFSRMTHIILAPVSVAIGAAKRD